MEKKKGLLYNQFVRKEENDLNNSGFTDKYTSDSMYADAEPLSPAGRRRKKKQKKYKKHAAKKTPVCSYPATDAYGRPYAAPAKPKRRKRKRFFRICDRIAAVIGYLTVFYLLIQFILKSITAGMQ